MTISRYDKRQQITNNSELYEQLFRERSVKYIKQFTTGKLRYPTDTEIFKLNIKKYRWKLGDRLYKYAYDHYGDVRLWWVIAWFNKKPTEAHFNIGDIVLVPEPLDRVLGFLEV